MCIILFLLALSLTTQPENVTVKVFIGRYRFTGICVFSVVDKVLILRCLEDMPISRVSSAYLCSRACGETNVFVTILLIPDHEGQTIFG